MCIKLSFIPLFTDIFTNNFYEAKFFGQYEIKGETKYGEPHYRLLKKELLDYNPDLDKRKYIIIRTKIDTKIDNDKWSEIDDYLEISSVSKEGIPDLIKQIGILLNEK